MNAGCLGRRLRRRPGDALVMAAGKGDVQTLMSWALSIVVSGWLGRKGPNYG